MKYIKTFKEAIGIHFDNDEEDDSGILSHWKEDEDDSNILSHWKDEEHDEIKNTINDYPQSVKLIYKRFNSDARKSIDDNPDKFAKIAKKVYYYNKKKWKDFFDNKEVKKLNTLTDVVKSLEDWMK